MKVLVGITQSLEQSGEFISKEFKGAGVQTEVGPFPTTEHASQWVDFIMARAAGCEQVTLPRVLPADSLWYGFVVELASS